MIKGQLLQWHFHSNGSSYRKTQMTTSCWQIFIAIGKNTNANLHVYTIAHRTIFKYSKSRKLIRLWKANNNATWEVFLISCILSWQNIQKRLRYRVTSKSRVSQWDSGEWRRPNQNIFFPCSDLISWYFNLTTKCFYGFT